MKVSASGQRRLLLLIIVVAAASVRAEDGPRQAALPSAAPAIALSPVTLPVTPQYEDTGGYGLRLRMRYLENLTGNLELRRHPYFHDDNLKTQRPRTSIAWQLRWNF